MLVRKCKWDYGKKTPVMLMIDDFANKYITGADGEGDWGAGCKIRGSFYDRLKKNILDPFPEVKVTLFLVVGKRTPIIAGRNDSYAYRIDEGDKFSTFLGELSENDKFEIAYHGYNHGEIRDGNFVQEWRCFETLDEAVNKINISRQMYESATQKAFRGGKYCGYLYNDFSDESIVRTGFDWWCRNYQSNFFKTEKEPDFSLSVFGKREVIDLPTTIDGNFYSLNNKKIWKHPRELIKALRNKLKYRLTLENELQYLIENQYIISIQEHSSPAREDGKIQYPNIVTDMDNLQYIFSYLHNYDCWYATGTEIANYYRAYKGTEIYTDGNTIVLEAKDPSVIGNYICIKIENSDIIANLWMNRLPVEKIGNNRFRIKIGDKKNILSVEHEEWQS